MTKTSDIRVVLADFQCLTRKALASLIEETPGFDLVALSNSLEELENQVLSLQPNLLILEATNNSSCFLDKISHFQQKFSLRLLVVTNSRDSNVIKSLIKTGVKGILIKDCSERDFVNALKTIAAGNRFYSAFILDFFVDQDQTSRQGSTSLSQRELQVLKQIAQGHTTKKIAKQLHISVHTVNSHRKNILKKLKLSSPIHLIAYAVEQRLVTIDYNKG
ncbi:response regulator transcription factor [Salegentibacter sp. HM20]